MENPEINLSDVAIIGIAGRFPGAPSVDALWNNICEGVESVTFFSDEELLEAGVDAETLRDPNYVKAKAILEQVENFDAAFFGLTPREAEITDPQHRLFMECAWEALENAGYDSEKFDGPIGLYAGAGVNNYLVNLYSSPELLETTGRFRTLIGNEKDHLATFTSYKLDLKGPGINVQTACSTSLVAVHLACQSLIGGECDIALAGGASIDVPQKTGQYYREGGIVSPDGHCRAFDARAQGTVGGSGVAVVALKRLADAVRDRDNVQAVIKGSAVNNDGAMKVGYTAPSVEGQARVIREAQRMAGLAPGDITCIEAHGTGTTLGDPIEIEALAQAFGAKHSNDLPCAIGSLKSNVGHLDTASGVAGLIKAALATKHGLLPPSLHFQEPNPKINLSKTRFYVNTRLTVWNTNGARRRAGVSSFGIGGTNAHVIVEQPPPMPSSGPGRSRQILSLSAKTDSALRMYAGRLAEHLRRNPDINLADAAYTLHVGRRRFSHRHAMVVENARQAIEQLEQASSSGEALGVRGSGHRGVVFLFPGQGAQYAGMGRDLYDKETVFQREMDRCFEVLAYCGRDDVKRSMLDTASVEDGGEMNNTGLAQVALFAIEYSLAKLWMSWGVAPEALIGHSLGEYVAACLAGVFSLEEGLELVAERARLMQQLPGGGMLAVGISESELNGIMPAEMSLAAVNGPELCVVSGSFDAVRAFTQILEQRHIYHRLLRTSHAFHSQMVEPMLPAFADCLSKITLRPPAIPLVSNVTGTWLNADQAQSPDYWCRHLRQTVRFMDGARELAKEPGRIYLETGPGRGLSTLVGSLMAGDGADKPAANTSTIISSLKSDQKDQRESDALMQAVAKFWMAGGEVDWAKFYSGQLRNRIAMTTYPFERERHWIDLPTRLSSSAEQVMRDPAGAGITQTSSVEIGSPDEMEEIIRLQLDIMSDQLHLLAEENLN